MPRVKPETMIAGAILIALAYVWLRGVKGVASDVSEFVVKSAEGAVIGVGKTVGIPETDAERCEAAIAAGEWWNASFYCPAGTFLKSATGAIVNPETSEVVGYTESGNAEIIAIDDETLLEHLAMP